jgi:pimeloyl-ACP methyl ester carboxylesterase
VRVQNRHVIYVQGYDPRGLAQYYRMFRTELRKYEDLYGLKATIGRARNVSEDEVASWTIETKADDWQTTTTYDFLRFEKFIRRDLGLPIWLIVSYASWIYLRLLFQGTIFRFMRANWRFLVFITWPHILLWLYIACLAGAALLFRGGLDELGVGTPYDGLISGGLFFVLLWTVLKFTEKRTYLLYLMCDTIWTWEFSHGRRPEWDQQIDRFAQYLCEVARTSQAQEIILVGHSSGSFLGTEILARALNLDPALGKRGPRVALLTLGGNYPIVGFQRAATDFRNHLRELAIEPSVDWIECQARKDVMNFFDLDPIASHGIDVGSARRNPTIVPLRFRKIIRPENYNRFRWQFFRVHFQFVMASEVPHAHDFFMIVCGPVPLRERISHPQAALAAITSDPAVRAGAWKALESPPRAEAPAPGPGITEPPGRHRG